MLPGQPITKAKASNVPVRVLAHLGDAVLTLYERQREVLNCLSAEAIHKKVACRVSAGQQAKLLLAIMPRLNDQELELVRMARNLKPSNYRKAGQLEYRQATALEALAGYLYLTAPQRLQEIFKINL